MLEIIKNICFFIITFCLFHVYIRLIILCKKTEKKLKEVTTLGELNEFINNEHYGE